MDNKNYINVIDFGSSKIRFSVFDKELNEKHNDNKSIKYENNYSQHLEEIKLIVKNAEKNISTHIEDLILTLDPEKLFTIDLTLKKKLDNKMDIMKIYETLILELKQIIITYYDELEIMHIIFSGCIIDNKFYLDLPKEKNKINNIKIDFKIICCPKKIVLNIKNIFNKINIRVTNYFCTSYVKSLSYLRKLSLEKASFLEIGYKRTNFICYENKKLKFIQSIPIGGMHITKDISNIFKITYVEAESIKRSFNKSETEFSYQNKQNEKNLLVSEILKKNISIDLLKKVILYRIQEIIDLTFTRSNIHNYNMNFRTSDLFFIGEGAILLNNNSFYLRDKFEFKSLSFYDEKDSQICNSILTYHLNNPQLPTRINKKRGLFEKFFYLFGK